MAFRVKWIRGDEEYWKRETHIADVLVGFLGSADFKGFRVHVDLGLALLIYLLVLQLRQRREKHTDTEPGI